MVAAALLSSLVGQWLYYSPLSTAVALLLSSLDSSGGGSGSGSTILSRQQQEC